MGGKTPRVWTSGSSDLRAFAPPNYHNFLKCASSCNPFYRRTAANVFVFILERFCTNFSLQNLAIFVDGVNITFLPRLKYPRYAADLNILTGCFVLSNKIIGVTSYLLFLYTKSSNSMNFYGRIQKQTWTELIEVELERNFWL